jgi:hypothetical protein
MKPAAAAMLDLRKAIERISRAADIKFSKHGQLEPVWFAFRADGEHFTLDGILPNKDLQAQFVRFIFQERDVVAYIFVDEAWVVEASMKDADSVTNMAALVGLEHHPNRREVVVIHAEDATNCLSYHRDIIRPNRGSAYLGPLILHDDISRSEGRFVGLLPRRGTLQ